MRVEEGAKDRGCSVPGTVLQVDSSPQYKATVSKLQLLFEALTQKRLYAEAVFNQLLACACMTLGVLR
jgi:hypothetical protein